MGRHVQKHSHAQPGQVLLVHHVKQWLTETQMITVMRAMQDIVLAVRGVQKHTHVPLDLDRRARLALPWHLDQQRTTVHHATAAMN